MSNNRDQLVKEVVAMCVNVDPLSIITVTVSLMKEIDRASDSQVEPLVIKHELSEFSQPVRMQKLKELGYSFEQYAGIFRDDKVIQNTILTIKENELIAGNSITLKVNDTVVEIDIGTINPERMKENGTTLQNLLDVLNDGDDLPQDEAAATNE